MGREYIVGRLDGVREMLDDLEHVADDETVADIEQRIDDLEADLCEAFGHEPRE